MPSDYLNRATYLGKKEKDIWMIGIILRSKCEILNDLGLLNLSCNFQHYIYFFLKIKKKSQYIFKLFW